MPGARRAISSVLGHTMPEPDCRCMHCSLQRWHYSRLKQSNSQIVLLVQSPEIDGYPCQKLQRKTEVLKKKTLPEFIPYLIVYVVDIDLKHDSSEQILI